MSANEVAKPVATEADASKPTPRKPPRWLAGLSRRPVAHHWRSISRTARWKLRDAMTRERLIANLKTLAWVAPLTILLWVYAETQQIVPAENQHVPIAVRHPDPDGFVKLLDPEDGDVVVEVAGPRTQVERVRRLLQSGGDGATVQLFIDPNLSPGEHELSVTERLNAHELFSSNGVEVRSADPMYITVLVDELVTRELEVVPAENNLNLSGEPAFAPERVEVRLPSRALADGQTLVVQANLAAADVPSEPGPHSVKGVPLIRPNVEGLTLGQTAVDAKVTVLNPESEYEYAALPIHVSGAIGILDTYRVVFQGGGDFLPTIRFVGPADQIEALKQSSQGPIAILDLSSHDVPGKDYTRKVQFINLPEDVEPKEPPSVTFQLVRRSPAD